MHPDLVQPVTYTTFTAYKRGYERRREWVRTPLNEENYTRLTL